MANLDKKGRIISNNQSVAPHTWFSCVHSDNDSERTIEDMEEDLREIDGKTILSIRCTATSSTVTVRINNINRMSYSASIPFVTETKAGVLTAEDFLKIMAGLMSSDERAKLETYPSEYAEVIKRIQGKSVNYNTHTDPVYYLGQYSGEGTMEQFNADIEKFNPSNIWDPIETWLDGQYVARPCPVGLINACIAGQHIVMINSPISYSRREYVQIAFGAKTNGNTINAIGNDIVMRKSVNGEWSKWTSISDGLLSEEDKEAVNWVKNNKEKLDETIDGSSVIVKPDSQNIVVEYNYTEGSGESVTIPGATPEKAGVMSAADKTKLDALEEAVELPTTSGTSFAQSNFYTIEGKLVTDIAYYTESIIQPGSGIVKRYGMAAYMGGKYYKYYQGRITSGKPTFDYSDTFTEANVPSDIASLFHASDTQSGLMSADDKALLNEHSILLNDFKIRTFTMEVDVDGNEIIGYKGTIGTFHVKEGELFKVKDLAEQLMKLSGTITSSDGFNMTFNSLNPAVADKDYYGTFTIKLYGKHKVAVSLV